MSIQRHERQVPLDTFPLRLVIARLHAGHVSAASAALAIGVSRQTWLNWERGIHVDAAMREPMLRWIAEKMDVNEIWLREGGPLEPPTTPNDSDRGQATSEYLYIWDATDNMPLPYVYVTSQEAA